MSYRYIFTIIGLLMAGTCTAKPIQFDFGGTVNGVNSELIGAFNVGDSFEGFYTFNSETPDNISGNDRGQYDAITSGGFNIGSYSGSFVGGEIFVHNDSTFGYDHYGVQSGQIVGNDVNGWALTDFEINLFDFSSTALDSDELPLTSPMLDDFAGYTYNNLRLIFTKDGTSYSPQVIVFNWADNGNFATAEVPEPTVLALMAIGLAGIGWTRRQKKETFL